MYVAIMSWDGAVATKYARFNTESEALAHVAAFSDLFPDAFVVSDPGGPEAEWIVDGNAQTLDRLTTTPSRRLSNAKAGREKVIRLAADGAIRAVVEGYEFGELQTWAEQTSEARRWDNTDASVPLIAAIASASGMATADLVAIVDAKVSAYKAAVGALLGRQRSLIAQITAATTIAEVEAVAW